MDKRKLAEDLLNIEAVKIVGPDNLFTWVSGIKSPIYCDNRMTISYPGLRDKIAEAMASMIGTLYPNTECIAGTATAGVPHAAWVAQKLELPMVYVRGESKGHGTAKRIEGVLRDGVETVLIEDLLSTGKSSTSAINALRESGANVLSCMSIFTYGFDAVEEAFSKLNIPYHSLTDYTTILEVALDKGYIPDEFKTTLLEWSKNPRMFTE